MSLMTLPQHVLDAWENQKRTKKRGHAAQPGTGPAGETCKTCAHKASNRRAKTYWKCGLTRATWTGGSGSDIRLKDPACSFWQAPE